MNKEEDYYLKKFDRDYFLKAEIILSSITKINDFESQTFKYCIKMSPIYTHLLSDVSCILKQDKTEDHVKLIKIKNLISVVGKIILKIN